MGSKTYLFFFVSLFFLFGCKKDDKPVQLVLSGVYVADTMQNISDVQMYTNSGQITDKNIISDFVKRYTFTPYSTARPFNSFMVNIKNDVDAIAITNNGNKVDTVNYSFLSRSPSGFVLRAADSTITSLDFSSGGILNDATHLFGAEFGRGCYIPVNNGSGFGGVCYYRPALQFDIKDNQIYLPFFSCQLSQDINHFNAINNVQGDFNTQIIKQLSAGDTLIFQTKRFLLIKE